MDKIKITDKRRSRVHDHLNTLGQDTYDLIFVEMVAPLADVQAASDLLCSMYEVEV